MALSILTSDSFDRANNPIGSSATLDNALGGAESNTWTVLTGNAWNIAGNELAAQQASVDNVVYVASTANAAICRTSLIPTNPDGGPIGRWTSGTGIGNFYLAYRNASTSKGQLYKCVNGAFTQLGSDGATTIQDTYTLAVDMDGTTIRLMVDSGGGLTAEVTVTDATFSSGKPGIYGGGGGAFTTDDFIFETDGGAGPTFPSGILNTPVAVL